MDKIGVTVTTLANVELIAMMHGLDCENVEPGIISLPDVQVVVCEATADFQKAANYALDQGHITVVVVPDGYKWLHRKIITHTNGG